MIELSLNEVEQLAAKVARGAGYSWGLADDVARSARVLAVSGLPWAQALVALARFRERATTSLVCPILTAARLSDNPGAWGAAPLRDVAVPLWLAAGATQTGAANARAISWHRARLRAVDDALFADDGGDNWLAAVSDVAIAAAPWPRPFPRARRANGEADVLAMLNAIAERVYVPASDVSRARGAGGGRVDDE